MTFRLFFILCIAFLCSCNFSPGSYPYAEKYEVSKGELELIKEISNFKKLNPEYLVPQETGLQDGRTDQGHWYFVYFYLKDKNILLLTWVRQIKENTSTIAFVSVNYGTTIGNWKEINHDLDSSENDDLKRIFETNILKNIY